MEKKSNNKLVKQYHELMTGFSTPALTSSGSKGQPFKIFSLYDHSKYVNHTATSLNL